MKKVINLISKANEVKKRLELVLFFSVPTIMVISIIYFSITRGTNVLIGY